MTLEMSETSIYVERISTRRDIMTFTKGRVHLVRNW